MRDLTRGPISGHLVAMAIPIGVGMLVQTLYYLVDLYFVSRLGDTALAGVSAAGNAMFLVFAVTQVLSVGTIAVVSHAVGAEDQPRATLALNQAVMLAGVFGVTTLLGGYLGLADLYMGTIGADEGTVAAGSTYLHWILPAMALHFLITAMGASLQGTGIVKPTMIVQLLTVVVNIILTPILVAGWGPGPALGVAGAGLASTLAAATGLILMTLYFARLERYVRFDSKQLSPQPEILRRILGIGAPAGGEFLLMFVYMALIYSVTSVFGATGQAGFGVGSRVMQAIFLPPLALAFATPAIAGQNFGAKNADRVRETFRQAVLMSSAFMVAVTVLCKWRPEWLVKSFASDDAVAGVATVFMTIISWNFVAYGVTISCSGMFQAMGNTWPAMASTATRLVTFAVPAFWLARQPGFRIEHVWYLSVASVALQMVVSLSLLRWQLRRRLRFS